MRTAWSRTRRYFWLACGFFVFGLVYGWLLPILSKQLASDLLGLVQKIFDPLTNSFSQAGPVGRILLILGNNLRASAVMFISGLTIIFPALVLFGNGMAVGLVGADLTMTGQVTLGRFALLILPHGIFELTALFIVAGLGWRLGLSFWRRLLGTRSGEGKPIKGDLLHLGLCALALLILAASIEALVTTSFSPS